MEAVSPAINQVQWLVLMIAQAIFSGGGFLGMPPGERDPQLMKAAPAESVFYAEWSSRAPGKEGAPGVEGFLADPEIKAFLSELDTFLTDQFGVEDIDSENPLLSKPGYRIVKRLMMRPGCAYVRLGAAPAREPKKDDLDKENELFGPPGIAGIEAALVVNAGDQAEALEADLAALLNVYEEEEERSDLKKRVAPITRWPWKTIIHRQGDCFIFAAGESTVDRVLERLAGNATGIAANARFAADTRAMAYERAGSLAWFDAGSVLASLKIGFGAQGVMAAVLLESVGLDSVKTITTATGLVDGAIHSRTRIATDGRTEGALTLFSGRAIRPSDLSTIPGDADFVWAGSLDLSAFLRSMKSIAGKADPAVLKVMEEGIKQWEQESGVLTTDATEAFDDVWTLHSSPSQGSLWLSGGVLSVGVKDAAKARRFVDRLQALIVRILMAEEDEGEDGPHFAEEEFLGQKISYLIVRSRDMAISPAFCLTQDRLSLAFHPQALKAQTRFVKSGQPGFQERWKRFVIAEDVEPVAIHWIDTPSWLRTVTAFTPIWGRVFTEHLHFRGNDFDPFKIPSASALLPYAMPASGSVSRGKEMLLFENRGGLPSPGGVSLLLKFSLWISSQMPFSDF